MSDFTSLAIDIGSTFGYAIGKNGIITKTGEVTLSAPGSHPGHRSMKFNEWLYKTCIAEIDGKRVKIIDELLIEDVPGFKSGDAAKMHGRLLGQLEVFSLIWAIRMCSLTPGQIKKDFTNNGNAKKEVMCDVAMNLGWTRGVRGTREYNNECDAIALLWVIYCRRGIQPAFARAA